MHRFQKINLKNALEYKIWLLDNGFCKLMQEMPWNISFSLHFLGLLRNLRNSNLFYGTLPLKVNSFHKIAQNF